jgi:ribosomal protein S18 acetylase RimI-like enzyme
MIEIRPAKLGDASAIVSLIQELAATSGDVSPITISYVEEYLDSLGSYVLLATDSSGISGLLSYSLRPDLYHAGLCCMVEELVVASGNRGQGNGGALLETVLAQAQAEGWAEVSVGVMPDNVRAQAFYRRHGLVEEAILLERHIR